MSKLNLKVKCADTQWGEQVAVIGSWNSWDKNKLTILSTGPDQFPIWTASIPVSEQVFTAPIHYKYVIVCDASIIRWEVEGSKINRTISVSKSENNQTTDNFGHIPSLNHKESTSRQNQFANSETIPNSKPIVLQNTQPVDSLEKTLQKISNEQRSWRQRLSFVRSLFADQDIALKAGFDRFSLDHLASISVFLAFLASGQIKCEEDGGHHRPNHHAHEARVIEASLAAISHEASLLESGTANSFVPYIIRRIYPHLPSYSSQFTVSVPLTRIRDIAHRGDIPHDLKQEIKHTLQNKLHRCAGPEDLQTSERILEKVSHGGYSPDFVHQFQIFHAELREFFNASSVDDRVNYLMNEPSTNSVANYASSFLESKQSRGAAIDQAEKITQLREKVAQLPILQFKPSQDSDDLPSEHTQKARLADIDLENYLFILLADSAKQVEGNEAPSSFPWELALKSLGIALRNVSLSGICPKEVTAIANELFALSEKIKSSGKSPENDLMKRLKAAIDRPVRFSHEFAASISDVYTRRAATLGRTFGVDDHAVAVFAEGEIRANIMFQASRLSDACSKICRKALQLPPWDALFSGETKGKVMFVENLSDTPTENDTALIVVCRNATGDEDIPQSVRGVILGKTLPHLSHLGVRARQAKVVFVCSEEQKSFEVVWGQQDLTYASLVVNSLKGLSSFVSATEYEPEDDQDNEEKTGVTQSKRVTEDSLKFDNSGTSPISLTQATQKKTSSKCTFAGKLALLASSSGGLFEAPDGIALPHGMLQEQISEHKKYSQLVNQYNLAKDTKSRDEIASKLRTFIKTNFVVSPRACKRIQSSFKQEARVMVRSSANAEDLEDMSGAGLYDSIANVDVHDTSSLQNAILDVWASLWTKRAASSRAACMVEHKKVSMAVLIQNMVHSKLSFIGFSMDPVSQNDNYCYVEIAVGMGETLASAAAEGSPYRFKISRKSEELETLSYASYSRALEADAKEKSVLLSKVVDYSTEQLTTDTKFRDVLVRRISKSILFLENEFGCPQDVEGAITIENDKVRLCIVQARPQVL